MLTQEGPDRSPGNRSVYILVTHSAVGVNFGALHGDGDTVEEDDDEDHVVKHLVGDDPVTQEAEPASRDRVKGWEGEAPADYPCSLILGPPLPASPDTTITDLD